ncbi:unnamed protein product [Gongylonema pulchrum]|uniref:HECT-type E3 ubiquitin transferase n=1 Tax=Gongylonema pulchrum TaxID=637853 RepID=A0A3P7M5G0_9BILA|nr:unnamed protein product [Gongylonema pulchrum]
MAALPDDIRAEVIRDYVRQQRARQVVQDVANAAGPPPGQAANANDGSAAAAAVEPIDQEFLNALPPDLQEEILAQHARNVRLARDRAESGNAPHVADAVADPEDAAALIESLPPALRAQVLADADDSVLQQVMRFARHALMLNPGERNRGPPIGLGPSASGNDNTPLLGEFAGITTVAPRCTPQLLDRDAIVTLLLLFFTDPVQMNTQRLQRLIKGLCAHAVTCDFVIWCLLALLNEIDEENIAYDDSGSTVSGWLDSICVQSGIGQHERAVKFFKDSEKAAIHPTVLVQSIRLVLETLTILAKNYPGHFLPYRLRTPESQAVAGSVTPPFSRFWHFVYNLSKADVVPGSCIGSILGVPSGREEVSVSMPAASLEESPLGILMEHMGRSVIRSSAVLQDKLMCLICTIVQTLPDDTTSKMSIKPHKQPAPLAQQLEYIVKVLTEGSCTEEGLADGRTLLLEMIRALTQPTRPLIMSLIFSAAERLGNQLLIAVEQLDIDLRTMLNKEDTSPAKDVQQSSTSAGPSTEQRRRGNHRVVVYTDIDESTVVVDDMPSPPPLRRSTSAACWQLPLPRMQALTDKSGVQYVFLKMLQTIVKIRDVLRKERIEAPDSEQKAMEGAQMSALLHSLEPLWELVSKCMKNLAELDPQSVLALQPSAEAFFLIYGSALSSADPSKFSEDSNAQKLISFAEKHRDMLNRIIRHAGDTLSDGPFAILIQTPRLLDFDVKRMYFLKQIKSDGRNRNEDIAVRIRRSHLFSDSFRELFRLRGPEWKARFYVIFEGEEGQDAGGLLREWFTVITREIFNPNYALFITAPGDRVTYMINKTSYINPEHLDYFKFVGRIIAKAIYENKVLECYFTRAFYKHILSVPVRTQDLESEDPSFYNSLMFLLEHPIEEFGTELTFSLEIDEFGVTNMRELKENGASIPVTDENKEEYVKLVCQMKMTGSISQQLKAFLDGFYEIIPKNMISIFNEQELELLISGLPNFDIDDLYANTDYKSYTRTSPQIQWFWRALRSFEDADRAKFLQFVTGTSKVPLQGFASLEGMNGVQKFSIHMDSRSADRLPTAHTCFNQLDLPLYQSYEKLRDMLLLAVRECTEGFGFA